MQTNHRNRWIARCCLCFFSLSVLCVPPVSAKDTYEPDVLENNYDAAHATPIAVQVEYELNLLCPDQTPGACPGGDHDYLRVPLKAGVLYLIATYDLGPGTDTVLDLFWGDTRTPIRSNDDAYTDSFASRVIWHAPHNGDLLVRIGPRNGGVIPVVNEPQAGSYHMAVALAESELAARIEYNLQRDSGRELHSNTTGAQIGTPRPTIAVSADAPTGPAVVDAESTTVRDIPSADGDVLLTLPREARVTLLGHVSGPWVRVQPTGSVLPGWVLGHDLRPIVLAPTMEPVLPNANPTPIVATPTLTAVQDTSLTVLPLDPVALPAPAPAPTRVLVQIEVELLAAQSPPDIIRDRKPEPTPTTQRPLVGRRVQLINVFGDLLGEALTGSDGRVMLSRDVSPTLALFVQVPAIGIMVPITHTQSTLRIALPEGR